MTDAITYEEVGNVTFETDDGKSRGPFTMTRATRADGKIAVIIGIGPEARRLVKAALSDKHARP
jgi:hypothetical protein